LQSFEESFHSRSIYPGALPQTPLLGEAPEKEKVFVNSVQPKKCFKLRNIGQN